MKRIIFITTQSIIFLIASGNALAFTCESVDGVIPPGGSSVPIDVRVNLESSLTSGLNQIYSLTQISCRNDVESWNDVLKTDKMSSILNQTLFPDFTALVVINGIRYSLPLLQEIDVMSLTQLKTKAVDIQLLMELNPNPTKDIAIHKGDVIGEFYFQQYNDQEDCPKCGPYRWRLIAGNDIYLLTNTCTINNSQSIYVQFNNIRQDLLTKSAQGSLYKENKPLVFNCANSNATQDVLIRLVSDAASFSSDLTKTSNSNIGIALIHNGIVVKPGENFRSHIVNGSGSDMISFVPVKNDVESSAIATGPLSASAILIFSAP
ncbi:fimbrial protein [Erwinia persicina]|uniref:fimbrial protein n=1 Tax=Erwinia persicina TaxID=55211 RepID=UPI0030CDF18A